MEKACEKKWIEISKKTIALTIIVFVLSIAAICFIFIYQQQRASRPVWLFKGAYAVYEAEGFILFIPYRIVLRLEVVEVNYPKFTLAMHMEFSGIYSSENTHVAQLEYKKNFWDNALAELSKGKISKRYEKKVFIEKYGLRDCIVYEIVDKNMKTVFYIDKKYDWIMRIDFIYEDYKICLKLRETNINFKD